MAKTLDRTKDIFLDTMLLGNEILIKKIKTTSKTKITVVLAAFRNLDRLSKILKMIHQHLKLKNLLQLMIIEKLTILKNNWVLTHQQRIVH